jgi:hypothetical protein
MTRAAATRDHDSTHIDYLRVTHDRGEPLRAVLRGPTELLRGGLSMFPHVERDGHGALYAAGGPEPRPFMLQLSGKPLAEWRAQAQDRDLIFQLAFDGVHCTRLDLARDTTGEWTPYRLRKFLDAERYVTAWRAAPVYTQQKGGPLTVQVGSRTSDVMLRCYDKRGEMLAKGEACAFPRLSRWELEIKGDLAPRAFEQLSTVMPSRDETTGEERWPLEKLHAAWLRPRLKLTTDPVDRRGKNQSRATADPAWVEFLSVSNSAVLQPGADERSPAFVAADYALWLRGLAASLAAAVEIAGADVVTALVDRGRQRLSAKHQMLIRHVAETRSAVRTVLGLELSAATQPWKGQSCRGS